MNSTLPYHETVIELNIYLVQISHALSSAEKSAVPNKRLQGEYPCEKMVRKNSELVKAKDVAKFWLKLWNECDRPKSGIVSNICLLTKCHFKKEVTNHRLYLQKENAEEILENPNQLRKLHSKHREANNEKVSDISENTWV